MGEGSMGPEGRATPGLLSRERILARPGFKRWLVVPCALAIHLCIGQVYALSVYKIPLTEIFGIGAPAASGRRADSRAPPRMPIHCPEGARGAAPEAGFARRKS